MRPRPMSATKDGCGAEGRTSQSPPPTPWRAGSGTPVKDDLGRGTLVGFAQVETRDVEQLCSVPHREFVLARRDILERLLHVPLEPHEHERTPRRGLERPRLT